MPRQTDSIERGSQRRGGTPGAYLSNPRFLKVARFPRIGSLKNSSIPTCEAFPRVWYRTAGRRRGFHGTADPAGCSERLLSQKAHLMFRVVCKSCEPCESCGSCKSCEPCEPCKSRKSREPLGPCSKISLSGSSTSSGSFSSFLIRLRPSPICRICSKVRELPDSNHGSDEHAAGSRGTNVRFPIAPAPVQRQRKETAMKAKEVIWIGRNRSFPPSTAASQRLTPSRAVAPRIRRSRSRSCRADDQHDQTNLA